MGRRYIHAAMEHVERMLQWAVAVAVAFWAALPQLTQLLLLLMVLDTALGIIRAVKQRDLSVKAAQDGATKKVGTLLLVAGAAVLNPFVNSFLEINLVQAASAFYIIPELTSITRHAAALDVPVFVQMRGVMRYFQALAGIAANGTEEQVPADTQALTGPDTAMSNAAREKQNVKD